MQSPASKVVVHRTPEDWDYMNLYPISDVHIGALNCREQEFEAYLEQIRCDDRAKIVLCGDLINNGILSSKTDVYNEKYTPREQKLRAIELLTPVADKVVGAVAGNHENRTVKEVCQDVMEDIAFACGFHHVYSRDAVFLKLQVGKKRENHQPAAYMIYLSHGSGGGGQIGSGANRQDRFQMSIEGVDITITGHTHKPMKIPSGRLFFNSHKNVITERNTLIFVCTSWLGYGDYAVRQQYTPTAFYPDYIRLDGTKKEWR